MERGWWGGKRPFCSACRWLCLLPYRLGRRLFAYRRDNLGWRLVFGRRTGYWLVKLRGGFVIWGAAARNSDPRTDTGGFKVDFKRPFLRRHLFRSQWQGHGLTLLRLHRGRRFC